MNLLSVPTLGEDARIEISCAGVVPRQQYNRIVHYLCCGCAPYNAAGNDTMVCLHALNDGAWHYAEMGVFDE